MELVKKEISAQLWQCHKFILDKITTDIQQMIFKCNRLI